MYALQNLDTKGYYLCGEPESKILWMKTPFICKVYSSIREACLFRDKLAAKGYRVCPVEIRAKS